MAAACAVCGWLSFFVPYRIAFASGATKETNCMDGLQMITLLLLPGVGFAAGALVPRAWFLWGACAVVPLPALTAFEILLDPTSHNLWPIELLFYAAFVLLATAGSGLGALVRWLANRGSRASTGS